MLGDNEIRHQQKNRDKPYLHPINLTLPFHILYTNDFTIPLQIYRQKNKETLPAEKDHQ